MNELKEAAHLMAQGIAKLGVQILPLLIEFITIGKNSNKMGSSVGSAGGPQ